MNEIKANLKKWLSLFLLAVSIIIVYKVLDNFTSVQQWFATFFRVARPFLIGLLIAYILLLPCRWFEKLFRKSKVKWIQKKARLFSIVFTYLIAVLLIFIVIQCIFPVLKDSVIELLANIQGYYETAIQKIDELPENSFLKSDFVKGAIGQLQNTDVKQILSLNNEKIMQYAQNILSLFSGIFDIFVSLVVSVYLLSQRTSILKFLRNLTRAIFKEKTFQSIDKYFQNGNRVFFGFLSSQILDAIVVGIMTTIAMSIIGVKYAPLLGFIIGLFNIIPYIGAIVAVGISILITLITGGIGQAIFMAVVVIVLQQIDANIINPKIIGHSLEISPLLVIFAVTIGGAYFGIMGMFLAVPVAAVIKTITEDYIKYRNEMIDQECLEEEDSFSNQEK